MTHEADDRHRLATEVIARAPLFRGVPPSARATVLDAANVRRLEPGTRLLSVGQRNTSLFIVLDGAVDVHLPGGEGPHMRVLPGECVGELSLIDDEPASADVVAALPTALLEVPYERVRVLIEASTAFALNLLRVLTGRVRHDDTALTVSSDRRRERLSMADARRHCTTALVQAVSAHLERLQRKSGQPHC
jgi:CRP-like cAMP-binding protein